MNNLFDKFTPRARKVLSLAQEEAQRFNHSYIDTEHLLLGLIRESDSTAAKVLAELGVDLNRARAAVEFVVGHGERIAPGDIGLTPRAKKVIEFAVDESRHLNHTYVGTEHLLLGLIREREGIAAGVLESLGVNLEVARQATLRALTMPGGTAESQESGNIRPSARLMGTQTHSVPPGGLPASGDTFDMFTARALQVLSLAQEEAQRLNHTYIGTEHLLLGLIRENDGVAAKVLANLGVSLPEVRQKVEEITTRGDRIVTGDIALSHRVRKVIKLALVEAHNLNQNYIGTEHLLLGLANESDGVAARVLANLGISLKEVHTQTIQIVTRSRPFQVTESALVVPPPMISFTFTPLAPPMNVTVSFTGLDEGAQHVLRLAFAEAQQAHQDTMSDVHILLGLILEGASSAAHALDQHGATIFALRRALDSITGFDDAQPGQVGVTPRAHAVLTNARTKSTRLGAPLITSEHILLGLLTLRNGRSIAALRQLGIDPGALYAELSQHMRSDGQTDQPPE